jgi:hypothetical protein
MLNAALDQAAAAIRDRYDAYGLNPYEDRTRLAILTTWEIVNSSEPNYQIGLYAVARALGIN